MAQAKVLKFPKKWDGVKNNRHFIARPQISTVTERKCLTCKRPTRRSWRTGVLHNRCFTCRYLVMIYGPNIEVEWVEKEE